MKRIVALSLIGLLLSPVSAFAGRPRGFCNNGFCAPTKPYVAPPVKGDRVIINNTLVGIPVPVAYNTPIAAQGTTAYGTGLSGFRYGSDMNVLFAQAGRFVDQAAQLHGQAITDFSSLVSQEGQNQATVAETLARGQVAAAVLQAATVQGQNTFQQRTFTFSVTQDANGEMRISSVPNAAPVDGGNADSLVVKHCAQCHNQGGEGFAKWSLTDAVESAELRLAGIRAVRIPNGMAGHMPKGVELDGETVAALIDELSQ